MANIEPIHRIRYENGVDPIDHAAYLMAIDLEIRDLVLIGEVHPGVAIAQLDQSYGAYARRMIGTLLDAGWTPPDVASRADETTDAQP